MKKILFKFPLLTIAIFLLLLYGIITFFFFSSDQPSSPQSQNNPTPTIGANSPEFLNSYSDEQTSFPQATPQAYQVEDDFEFVNENMQTGSLVVTSDIDGLWVYIDPPPDTHAEAPIASELPEHDPVPPQYTPFRVDNIPVGIHRVIGVKPNYIAEDLQVEIKQGQVTQLYIDLKPVISTR